MRKPVSGVCCQVRLLMASSVSEDCLSLVIWAMDSIGILLSMEQIKPKMLIILHKCTGWSASLLFAYGINRSSWLGIIKKKYTFIFVTCFIAGCWSFSPYIYVPHRRGRGRGRLVSGADSVSVTLSCLHNISWTGGWILTKFVSWM